MTEVKNWLSKDEGWKAMLASVYAIICLFDFIVVPVWIGFHRPSNEVIEQRFHQIHEHNMPPEISREMIKPLNYQHDPFTLKGGGLFHLSFGALLTGSALSKKRKK